MEVVLAGLVFADEGILSPLDRDIVALVLLLLLLPTPTLTLVLALLFLLLLLLPLAVEEVLGKRGATEESEAAANTTRVLLIMPGATGVEAQRLAAFLI